MVLSPIFTPKIFTCPSIRMPFHPLFLFFMDWKKILGYWPAFVFGLFCLAAAIQLFYYLFFFIRLAFYKKRSKSKSITHPVSVIVCARDEANNLEKFLPELLTQEFGFSQEVIVVNDNSNDDTKFFLEELQRTFRQLKPLTLTHEAVHIPGKKYPLSMGIKSSRYEVLLLTDADCMPASSKWISTMMEAYDEGVEIVLGYGAFLKKGGVLNRLVRYETYHTALQYLSYALAGTPYMGVGRNLSYRKDLFYRNKGFSSMNHIPGGDDDLFINKVATKRNLRIAIDPEAFTLSEPPQSLYQWWRQKSRHYSTAKYYKPIHQFLLALYAASHFLFYPLLIVSAIFFDWRLALGVYAVRLLVQGIVNYKTMKRLNEGDLFPWFWLLDIWQFLYYFIFSFTLIGKPRSTWK
jgi:glycosyltransferase involved in cell wall biosynthesis